MAKKDPSKAGQPGYTASGYPSKKKVTTIAPPGMTTPKLPELPKGPVPKVAAAEGIKKPKPDPTVDTSPTRPLLTDRVKQAVGFVKAVQSGDAEAIAKSLEKPAEAKKLESVAAKFEEDTAKYEDDIGALQRECDRLDAELKDYKARLRAALRRAANAK